MNNIVFNHLKHNQHKLICTHTRHHIAQIDGKRTYGKCDIVNRHIFCTIFFANVLLFGIMRKLKTNKLQTNILNTYEEKKIKMDLCFNIYIVQLCILIDFMLNNKIHINQKNPNKSTNREK